MIGLQGFSVPTKRWGRVHQPPLFNTPPFCTEVYLARMFDLVFFLSMNFACMLGPCAPKKAPFCKNLFLYHYLSWAWNTFTQNLCYLEFRGSISYKMEGFSSCPEKICKAWIPYKTTLEINQVIPYKMNGPNPAKFSNCMSRFLCDSDFIWFYTWIIYPITSYYSYKMARCR